MKRTRKEMEGEAETHCPPPQLKETRLGELEKQKAMGGAAALQVCPL